MPRYDAATDYDDCEPPEAIVEGLPSNLSDAMIKGGETYPADESVRLNGPPGVGKTTQIALRVGWLIEECGVDACEITIATYRRSLAAEVASRLEAWGVIDENDDTEMWTTAHAAANRVTGLLSRSHDEHQRGGLGPAVTAYEKAHFCSEMLDVAFYPAKPWDDTRGQLLFNVIDYAHNNLIDPTDESALYDVPAYQDLLEEWPGVDVPEIYGRWQEFKAFEDLVEFHELLEAAAEPDAPLPPTRVVVIDEYHDAYPLMAKVAERWVDAADTAIVAGDPLQVVNAYSGADPRFFTERMDHLPEVLLDRSWRVAEEHWQAATRMLQAEFDAPPISREGRGEIIEYRSPSFGHVQGAGWTELPGRDQPGSPGALVEEHVADHNDRDMLLLARTQKQIRGISAALDRAGIIHVTQDVDDVGGWSERRVDVLNAILKLRIVPGNYGEETAQTGLLAYSDDAAELRLSGDEAAAILEHAHGHTLDVPAGDVPDIADGLRADDEHKDVTVTADDLAEHVEPAFWRRYTDGAASVKRLTQAGEFDDGDLKALQNAAARYDDPVGSGARKRVRALTIHASKGSEATDVVVYDGITGRITAEMEQSQSTRENEARTWYVALTRASERLHIMREGFEWTKPHLPRNLAPVAAQAAERAVGGAGDGGESA